MQVSRANHGEKSMRFLGELMARPYTQAMMLFWVRACQWIAFDYL